MSNIPLDETENVISATECTGLVPAMPLDDPTAERNLASLYAVHPPKKRKHKKTSR